MAACQVCGTCVWRGTGKSVLDAIWLTRTDWVGLKYRQKLTGGLTQWRISYQFLFLEWWWRQMPVLDQTERTKLTWEDHNLPNNQGYGHTTWELRCHIDAPHCFFEMTNSFCANILLFRWLYCRTKVTHNHSMEKKIQEEAIIILTSRKGQSFPNSVIRCATWNDQIELNLSENDYFSFVIAFQADSKLLKKISKCLLFNLNWLRFHGASQFKSKKRLSLPYFPH